MRTLAPSRAVVIVFWALALLFGGASWKLGYWVDGAPGPGLLPIGASVLLVLSASFLFAAPPSAEEHVSFARLALAAFGLVTCYGLTLPFAGTVLPSLVLGTLWMRILHDRSTLQSMLTSVAIVGAVVLLFRVALGVQIPLWPNLS